MKHEGGGSAPGRLLTVKEVAELTGLSPHTLRYYDRMHLFPYVSRSGGNARLFSESDVEWVRLVSCLRKTGLPIADILRYVELCQAGDGTIGERAEIIGRQEAEVERRFAEMGEQLALIRRKKAYYDRLLAGKLGADTMNPETPRQEGGSGEQCC
jgi:DNA-binding transcriptional MerR regulator